jgi:hypothetical protein
MLFARNPIVHGFGCTSTTTENVGMPHQLLLQSRSYQMQITHLKGEVLRLIHALGRLLGQ